MDAHGESGGIRVEALSLVVVFESIREQRLTVGKRAHLFAPMKELLYVTPIALRSQRFLQAMDAAWTLFELSDPDGIASGLLRSEMRSIVIMYERGTGAPIQLPERPDQSTPPRTWNKEVTAKDTAGALETVLGSLRDALEFLPSWARAIIKAFEEAVSILAR